MTRFKIFTICCLMAISLFSCNADEPVITDDGTTEIPIVNAKAFLTADDFASLTVEFIVMKGNEPSSEALNDLTAFLNKRLNKPSGIKFKTTKIGAIGKETYSISDISKIIDDNRTLETTADMLVAHILLADGEYEQRGVLGLAYGSNRMCIFEKYIKDNTGGLTQPKTNVVESTVLQHEFCHIMGMVNVGTPNISNHEDLNHKGHCDNEECLMYWAVESGDFLSNLIGAEVPMLDANCLNDLKTNGGK